MGDPDPSTISPYSVSNSDAFGGTKSKEFRLGLLLVHGMGTQPARDTLVRWGDAIIKLIGRATKPPVRPIVSRASGNRTGDQPAEVVVEFSGKPAAEKWLFTEGWWADSFPPPTYSELVSWSVRALPWSITLHIAQRYRHVKSRSDSGGARVAGLTLAILQLLVALALSPVFVTLLTATLILGVLPFPQLRTLILSTQSLLLGTVGDSLAFVESPLRSALVRTRILDGLKRLQSCCDKTIIIAHSQGAAATLDALGGIMTTSELLGDAVDPAIDEANPITDSESTPNGPVPNALVTFGSGVNQLVSLKVLTEGLPKKTLIGRLNPASVGVVAVLAMVGWFLFLYASIRSGRTTVPGLLQAAEVLLGSAGSAWLLVWAVSGVTKLIKKLIAKKKKKKKTKEKEKVTAETTDDESATQKKAKNIQVWVIVLVMVCWLVAFFVAAERYSLPMLTVASLFYPLAFLSASLILILSDAMATALKAPVRMPPGLSWWIDLFASADPVPNGPSRKQELPPAENGKPENGRPEEGKFEPGEIWNRGSILSDHTTYWENLDGFVLRVVRVCAQTAESPWINTLPEATSYSEERAAWRVNLLKRAVRFNTLLWLIAFVPLWTQYQQRVPVPLELPAWAPVEAQIASRTVILFLVVAVAAWSTSALLRWLWSFWVHAEQRQVLGHAQPAGKPWVLLIGMGVITSLLLFSLKVLVFGNLAAVEKLNDPKEWVRFLILVGWGGVLFAWLITLRLKPPIAAINPPE